jgi:drug/metabolite transporter (DMT)-like permease
MKLSTHSKGFLLTSCGVLILSPDSLLVRLIGCDIWTLLFWRCLLTSVMMTIFLFFHYRKKIVPIFFAIGRTGLFAAATITIGSLLFVASITHTTAANALIILAATPIISSLLSWLVLRERISTHTKLAIFACSGGILLIFSGSLQSGLLLGDCMALGATAMWSANVVIVRHGKDINMIPATLIGNFCVAPIALILGAQPFQITPTDASLLLLLGGLLLPIAFTMITLGPRYLQAPEVSLILLLETLLGPTWVWLVLDEVPHQRTLIAGGLILVTLVLHTLASTKNSQRTTPQ